MRAVSAFTTSLNTLKSATHAQALSAMLNTWNTIGDPPPIPHWTANRRIVSGR